jgi:hypothetical protein
LTTLLERYRHKYEESGDCLEWQGACNNGVPQVRYRGVNRSLRRLILEEVGRKVYKTKQVTTKCENPKCINPDHLVVVDLKKHLLNISAKGNSGSANVLRVARIRQVKRSTKAKLTEQDVLAIRASEETCRALSAKYGVDKSLISKIKRHAVWRDVQTGPFGSMVLALSA